jgi:hypothetical protein
MSVALRIFWPTELYSCLPDDTCHLIGWAHIDQIGRASRSRSLVTVVVAAAIKKQPGQLQ